MSSSRRRTTVVGTVAAEAPGQGDLHQPGLRCCHTFTPAGRTRTATIGPDLDKLPQYAKAANQPLKQFMHESIVDPNKYIEQGYPKNVMPKSYDVAAAGRPERPRRLPDKPQG